MGEAYERFLIEDLKPFVDAHYHTRRDPAGTFIIGSSMGGLIAFAAPPNILFIFSDDHAYQAVSAYQHPLKLLNTPNIDRLAKEACSSTAHWCRTRFAGRAARR